ncbi:hypothetical protein BOX15_Mlig005438g1 [Macrostomum lignano]|uniref:Uncharacterized protein n=2 Tax=Macrostomum lignano TaxID=282301 RepID=A0A267GZX9_9PLAT|nr:hypothetical protein BOX15_Mlig005438g1 [Macrostomum lignano]
MLSATCRAVRPSSIAACRLAVVKRAYYLSGEIHHEPFHPIPGRNPEWLNGQQAFERHLDSAQHIFIHGGAATPNHLIDNMVNVAQEKKLKDIKLMHIHTEGPAKYNEPEYEGIFRSNSLFTSSNCRKAIQDGRADFTPIFLSEIPLLFRRNHIKLDMALIMVTPPDRHGFCSLGPSVDCTRAAIQNARVIIAQVNPKSPRTRGDAYIHSSHVDCFVHMPENLQEMPARSIDEAEVAIGKQIAQNLVENGATLQMGIGSIPDAVLAELGSHKDLGVHSEMFSDGIVDLTQTGAITNARKKIKPGKIVSGFVIGSNKVFNFINDNPFVELCDIQFTNRTAIICENPQVTAINSCIEVDLTGQVVSDSIGPRIYSGVGGQIDFIRGAALCTDGRGKPIIALQSATKKGVSKITPFIKEGAGVVTTRAHVHYIVTEHGIAQLWGKNLRQRAYHLIQIAHPDHRKSLEEAAFKRLKCMPSPD